MPDPHTPARIRFPVAATRADTPAASKPALPAALTLPGSRGDRAPTPLIDNVEVLASWELSPARRSEDAAAQAELGDDNTLLALEAADGTTVFMRVDVLAARIAQVQPDALQADGSIDFARFRDRDASTRGLGDWIWRRVTALRITPDAILDAARDKILEHFGDKAADKAWEVASLAGARALMSAIESQLAGDPGLYQWRAGAALQPADRCGAGDARLAALADGAAPALIFIHGTGSHTLGGFGDLLCSREWAALRRSFGDHVYGFEHRTFSESPIDNAIALLEVLPVGARLNLVTHSRGGLVGDLLCLAPPLPGGTDAKLERLIRSYERKPNTDELEAEKADPALRESRLAFVAEEQARLRRLIALLQDKRPVIERYVRVAAPARGTALLSDNLDLFLSGLLALVRKLGGAAIGALTGALATPAAGEAARRVADQALRCLARVVTEIAHKRVQPQWVPGIEAMLPEAPMGMLLGSAASQPGVRMGVIAGDIEGGNLLKRIGVMFTDWMFFDQARNDLVVDTASMYGGVAHAADARAIFVRGAEVSHFSYFRDSTLTEGQPLPQALREWLQSTSQDALPRWKPMIQLAPVSAASRGERRQVAPNTQPVVVYLPGIMGSELSANGDDVWLNLLAMGLGGLSRIAIDSGETIEPDDVVRLAYGKLKDHLHERHYLETFTYDWRQPLTVLGPTFARALTDILARHPDQPVRILAHSMGGLVVRAAFAHDATLWDRIVARDGGRLVMMGTPNHGAHLMVQTLFGLSDTMRMLARLDLRHPMSEVLKIVGAFQGAINLLPAPGFIDAGGYSGEQFYRAEEWERLANHNNDFWFGKKLCGRPNAAALALTRTVWEQLADTAWMQRQPERIHYVYGKADATPCGLVEQRRPDGSTLNLLIAETPFGDGSVTWRSGRLSAIPAENCWLMPVDHTGLANTPKYFDEIDALLEGRQPALKRLPTTRGEEAGADAARTRRAGPPPGWPGEDEAILNILGGHVEVGEAPAPKATLSIRVAARDLRFVHVPVLCGHYRDDPIAGAEWAIDSCLVNGALTHRKQLGIHSGELGSATIVLMPRSMEERKRQSGRGAVVVGLGPMGKLAAAGVTEAVRAGVLRYLLHAGDRYGEECALQADAVSPTATLELPLASVLIGSNSAAQLEIAESVKAVVLGVLFANRDFNRSRAERGEREVRVARLELIELYLDTAISAAHEVGKLERSLERELQQVDTRIDAATELHFGMGVRQRLRSGGGGTYWPRLQVTDADRDDTGCAEECYVPRIANPIPPRILSHILKVYGRGGDVTDTPPVTGFDLPPDTRPARRLRFTYMGEKARAESVSPVRQPGAVETLIEETLGGHASTQYAQGSGFGNTLFQLLVPLEFKAAARKTDRLMLVVDRMTANLPWELLETDGKPMVLKTRMVRQFVTSDFRREVIRPDGLSACVISNPSTEGYHAQFGGPGWTPRIGADGKPEADRLPSLPGAAEEGDAIIGVLERANYTVAHAPPDCRASDVFTRLFSGNWRIVVINAHGIFGKRARDGSYRSGVVLSDGLLLSASEIELMETVPELVFINCCHLAKGGSGGGRLAASLSQELIAMGVRCIVAAGWEVRDDAAKLFATTFFEQMLEHGASFGDAVHRARDTTFNAHRDCNTWGAYQAYGDPDFRLRHLHREPKDDYPLTAPEELLDWLEQRRLEAHLPGRNAVPFNDLKLRIDARLGTLPGGWKNRADIQQSLGRLLAEYPLKDSFAAAHAAYLNALRADSSAMLVPFSAIEQLINLESREAERLCQPGPAQDLATAQALADSAVRRAQALATFTDCGHDGEAQPGAATALPPNMERMAITGSAYKRRAIVLLRGGAGWDDIAAVLQAARDAYHAGEGQPGPAPWAPYACINRLQLDALVSRPSSRRENLSPLVEICQTAARGNFERSYGFFDAVMSADATLAAWLLGIRPSGGRRDRQHDADDLFEAYRAALNQVAHSPRELDSVLRQIRLLAEFLARRNVSGDATRVKVLDTLADRLDEAER
ncbi:CHAT domain-containing protein [Azoarcus sp. L1K30]|uniref:DUF7379 domain-containing protein n=1 Tax=Azoarcus sp. L1K30 TaxID=2820277 RepID=UPI001B83B9EB|nr:CHAT domain-containing protein [Azoarcus sp. L1K30]MBR0565108.1 CHAT domain-containing protein [Azoarcus sp. L1K30]